LPSSSLVSSLIKDIERVLVKRNKVQKEAKDIERVLVKQNKVHGEVKQRNVGSTDGQMTQEELTFARQKES